MRVGREADKATKRYMTDTITVPCNTLQKYRSILPYDTMESDGGVGLLGFIIKPELGNNGHLTFAPSGMQQATRETAAC